MVGGTVREFGMVIYDTAVFKKWMTNMTYCMAHETLLSVMVSLMGGVWRRMIHAYA